MKNKKIQILLDYAEERERNRKQPTHSANNDIIIFTDRDFGKYPKTEEELKPLLGQRWKANLCLLGSFFEEYKYSTVNYLESDGSDTPNVNSTVNECRNDNEEEEEVMGESRESNHLIHIPLCPASFLKTATILNISCRSRNLRAIYSNRTKVWRVIQLLLKIKGLVPASEKYRFVFRNKKVCEGKGRSMKYAYNKAMEKLVLSLVAKYDLNLLKAETVSQPKEATFDFNPELFYKIRVSSKLKIAHCTETQCREILDRKYGELSASRLRKAIAMNFTLPKEQKIYFDWNIHKSTTGFITKIGARATSELVSYKSRKKELEAQRWDPSYSPNSDYAGEWREDYLDSFFGRGNWFEFDVRGSIYQISHLLNHGEWLGNKTDPYARMFGQPFADNRQRGLYKSLCMSLYFDRTTTIITHNRLRTPLTLNRYGKEAIQASLVDAEYRMRNFTGDKFDSEVFFHESMLYLDFVWELRQQGISVVQVYDGFYLADAQIGTFELDALMHECAMSYLEDYRKWSKTLPKP